MNASRLGLLAAGLAFSGAAAALDVGVMESAESIDPNYFKLGAYPLGFERDGAQDDDGAFAVSLGYGLPYGLDVEGLFATSDEGSYFGSDLEWSAWRKETWIAFSFGGGLHFIDLERGGTVNGLDTTAIFSFTPRPGLDLNAALDASFEDVNVDGVAGGGRYGADDTYEIAYFAPGLEYSLTRQLDVLAEAGVGLNGSSDDYLSAGLSWYFGDRSNRY